MGYVHLKKQTFVEDQYSVVPIRREDMLNIKQWRNEQMVVLRQTSVLTDKDQLHYYDQIVEPSFTDKRTRLILFSYFLKGDLIGYGGLTNIDWINRRAEISYLVETSRSSEENQALYEQDFSTFLKLMQRVAFGDLGLHRLYTETFDIRPFHIQVLEQSGFQPEGRLKEHVFMNGCYLDSILHGCIKESTAYVEE